MAQHLQRRIALIADLRVADDTAVVWQPGDAAAVVIVAVGEHRRGDTGEIDTHQRRIAQKAVVGAGIEQYGGRIILNQQA